MEIAKISREELDKFQELGLSTEQLNILLKATPKKYLKTRPGKGGQQWTYVTGGYVNKVLNLAFGWNWDFEILDYKFDMAIGQAFVHGRLTVRINNEREITLKKEQFGRVDIKFLKGTKNPVDLGNDLKAASTDALKKCASLLGVASDIYNKEDFAPVEVTSEEVDPITERLKHFLGKCTTLEEIEEVWEGFLKSHTPTSEQVETYNQHLELFD